jgi:hypothetical protein
MANEYLTPDQWATVVVCVVLGLMAFGGSVSAVVRRGGRRG